MNESTEKSGQWVPPPYHTTKAIFLLRSSIAHRWSYPPPTPVARALREISRATRARADTFDGIFIRWLAENWNVWMAFYGTARQAQGGGMKHWSSRGVIHVLRWKTATRDSCKQFKINDHNTPSLARLYNAVFDTDFFRLRGGS